MLDFKYKFWLIKRTVKAFKLNNNGWWNRKFVYLYWMMIQNHVGIHGIVDCRVSRMNRLNSITSQANLLRNAAESAVGLIYFSYEIKVKNCVSFFLIFTLVKVFFKGLLEKGSSWKVLTTVIKPNYTPSQHIVEKHNFSWGACSIIHSFISGKRLF
jgi:hypothetical protein